MLISNSELVVAVFPSPETVAFHRDVLAIFLFDFANV